MKYNWQLNAYKCVVFLEAIIPYLILKKEQAQVAIAWHKQRPERIRDARGRVALSKEDDKELNVAISLLMKRLKFVTLDEFMQDAADLIEIKHTLHQIVNVKGD